MRDGTDGAYVIIFAGPPTWHLCLHDLNRRGARLTELCILINSGGWRDGNVRSEVRMR